MLKKLLICLCTSFLIGPGEAQHASRFQSVTSHHGLPSNYVFAVSEDEDGFMWIGTDKGLGRFDGFQWKIYDSENGLPGNYIPQFACNQQGGIWLMIPAKGIYYFDKKTGQCTFSSNARALNGFQVNKEGDLFFCDVFSGETGVRGLQVSKTNPEKVLTVFYFRQNNSNQSISADFASKTVTVFGDTLFPPGNIELKDASWKLIRKPFLPTGNILLRQAGKNLFYDNRKMYFLKGNKFDKVYNFPFDGYYLQALQEPDGVWLWNMKDGLFWLEPGKPLRHYNEKDGLSSLIVNDVYRSRRGDLLISTLGSGLLKMLRPGNARIDTDRSFVKGLAYNKNTVYALLENRLVSFDIMNPQEVQTFIPPDKSLQKININDNKLYINTLFGYSEYALDGKVPRKLADTRIGAGVSSVIKVGGGLAIGTYGSGIHFKNEKGELSMMPKSLLVSEKLLEASDGFFSLNNEDGFQHFVPGKQPELVSIKNGLPTNYIIHIHEYRDTLWMSTRRGLTAMHKGKVVLDFPMGESLYGSHCVYSFHDTSGNFWIVTNRYLHEFDGKQFFKLSASALTEGKDDQIYEAMYHPPSNTLVTGSGNRIFITKPGLKQGDAFVHEPKLSGVKVDDKPKENIASIKLPADFVKICFRFHPGPTSPFFNTNISYKLKGLHEKFIPLSDSSTVSFSKLRSGNYTLLAKAINLNGRESKVVELASFKVMSPFWQRGWFIILTTLLFTGGVFYLYGLYKKNKYLRQKKYRLMEERVSLERIRISKDLHDHLGTSLVTMIAQTENIENKLRHNKVDEALEKVKQLSDQSRDTIDVLRETIWAVQENTHTISEFVLRTRNFLHRVNLPGNIEWEVSLTGGGQSILSANQTLQLFRVIQESTQNIIKHSGATHIRYAFFENNSELRLEINDNGIGFLENSPGGNGMVNIQHRVRQIGGTVDIHSNSGTKLFITIPLRKQKNKR